MNEYLKEEYRDYISNNNNDPEKEYIVKIPYIECVPELTKKIPVTYETIIKHRPEDSILGTHPRWEVLRDINIKMYPKTKEKVVQIYQRSLPISKFGRLRGNMEYLEDAWDIQIQPPAIKYAFLSKSKVNNELLLTEAKQMRIRDKYLRVRVRYDGKKYAIINAIRTYFTTSHA